MKAALRRGSFFAAECRHDGLSHRTRHPGGEQTVWRYVVLHGIDLTLFEGEIVAVMGANGAGKSTLVQILSGVHQMDSGKLLIDGREQRLTSPAAARAAGVVCVHQVVANTGVASLLVAENLLFDALCGAKTPFFMTPGSIARRARRIALESGLDLDLSAPFASLGLAERQMVAIARAISGATRILILDEPTASLSAGEAERLFALLERLRAQGLGILFISHRLADLERLADRVVVIRHGRIAGQYGKPLDLAAATLALMGRKIDRHARGHNVSGGRTDHDSSDDRNVSGDRNVSDASDGCDAGNHRANREHGNSRDHRPRTVQIPSALHPIVVSVSEVTLGSAARSHSAKRSNAAHPADREVVGGARETVTALPINLDLYGGEITAARPASGGDHATLSVCRSGLAEIIDRSPQRHAYCLDRYSKSVEADGEWFFILSACYPKIKVKAAAGEMPVTAASITSSHVDAHHGRAVNHDNAIDSQGI